MLSVATQVRSLRVKINDGVLVAKLLRAALEKFDAITSSIEQFGDIDSDELKPELFYIVVVCFNSYNTFLIPHLGQ